MQELARENHTLTQLHNRRLREQKTLIETNHDLEQLRIAMTNCSSLQEIKLLRLQDEADEQLIDFIERHTIQNTQHQSRFDWGSACSRAVMNLSIALLGSRCTSIRFIGPQISPETSLQLFQVPSTTLADLGSRLTSLDISFPSHGDITTKIARLSGVLGRFFGATKSLVSIHIGFPKAPLNLELDAIFHGIGWKTLRTLSLEGWRLADHEIIALARRHRRMLRELRLCAVYLRPGGRWRDVLCVLREEMERLDGLDLRDIDYEEHSMAISAAYGVEVFDVQSSASFPSSLPRASPPERRYSNPRSGILPSQTNQRGFRRDLFAKVRDLALDDLGDDGIQVHQDQIRLWEAWVLSGTRGMFNGHSRPYGS